MIYAAPDIGIKRYFNPEQRAKWERRLAAWLENHEEDSEPDKHERATLWLLMELKQAEEKLAAKPQEALAAPLEARCPGCGSAKLWVFSHENRIGCDDCRASYYFLHITDFAQFFTERLRKRTGGTMPIKGPIIQTMGGQHLCTACGKEHMNCCGMCAEFDPEDYGRKVPCDYKCGHTVCNEARSKQP